MSRSIKFSEVRKIDGAVVVTIPDEMKRPVDLIEAAPDMLEALENTLSCIDQHTDDPILGPIIECARLAIAKARGKS